MDQDDIGSDEVAGSILLDTKEAIEGKYKDLFMWKNVMGCPLNQSNSKAKDRMNKDPTYASTWKGRILV